MSTHKSNHQTYFSKYDSISTEELEELLDKDLYASESQLSADEILYITNILLERDKENKRYDIPDVEESWKQFVQKYMK